MHYDVFSSVIFMDGMVYHPKACYTASFSIRGVWNIWVDQNGNRCYNRIIQMDKGEIKMKVSFENAYIMKHSTRSEFIVSNKEGMFRVYWCDKIKHYKIETYGGQYK